jgi:hypothetical protein
VNGTLRLAGPIALALAVAACNAGGSSSVPAPNSQSATRAQQIPQWEATHAAYPACSGPRTGGLMQCDVLIDTAKIDPNTPGGWGTPNGIGAF